MAFIPAPNVAEVRMQYAWDNQQVENVFHFKRNTAWDAAGLNELAGTFVSWWTSQMRSGMPSNCILQRVIARDLTTQDGIAVEEGASLPLAGTNSGTALPNNVTVAVKWGTGLAGRSFRGRTYQIGLTDGHRTGNALTTTAQSFFRGAYDALRTALDNVTLNGEFVVLSRYHNGVPRTTAVATPISGVSVERTLDSQRRRLPGRGS